MSEVEDLLTEYNVNAENSRIIDFYHTDNIWKSLRIERDENKHSAFLAWLLKKDYANQNSPIHKLLNLLVRKSRTDIQFPGDLKRMILTRNLRIKRLEITPEKLINQLSVIRFSDRLDLFVECDIYDIEHKSERRLEIIFENKVDSPEGKNKLNYKSIDNLTAEEQEYAEYKQTKRYYYACSKDNNLRKEDSFDSVMMTQQLFVFLTSKEQEPEDKEHFITITYQDLVDFVFQPYLNGGLIDEYSAQAVREYLQVLSNPFNKRMTTMATTQEEKELLIDFYTRNEALFKKALEVMRDNADTEEEENSYKKILVQINKKPRRFFRINNRAEKFRMYEVVAEFIKHELDAGKTLQEVETFIKNATREQSQTHVSTNRDVVKRGEKAFEFNHSGKTYYVTKEWGNSEKCNFKNLMGVINKSSTSFRIEEII